MRKHRLKNDYQFFDNLKTKKIVKLDEIVIY